jgi:hypothetical protein
MKYRKSEVNLVAFVFLRGRLSEPIWFYFLFKNVCFSDFKSNRCIVIFWKDAEKKKVKAVIIPLLRNDFVIV